MIINTLPLLLLPTIETPMRLALRAQQMITTRGLLSINAATWTRLDPVLPSLRSMARLAGEVFHAFWSADGADSFHVLLCVIAACAPGVDPLSALGDGFSEASDRVHALAAAGERL